MFGRAAGEELSALFTSLGAHVDDIVGGLDDVEVVLDDDDRVALVNQAVEHGKEDAYVFEMQPRGRLVEDVECASRVAPRQFGGELDALALASGEGGRRLPEADVAETDVLEDFYLVQYLGDILEELDGAVDGHVEHVGDGLALETHFERLAVVAFAVADLAGDEHVREEVHLDDLVAVAPAGLAPSAADVEREASGLVAAHLRLGQSDKE